MLSKYLEIKPEIENAIKQNQPVVALESTIIAHGMPYPQNIETARKVEEIVRQTGAIPATIGILNGMIKVGLNAEELELMGHSKDVAKVSRRDLPIIIANKANGATTVASTMIIAELAGIKIFVTGGIGGVHREAQQTFDISADLTELAKTNVAVVCAGAKSILDIELTLEYLETQGVPVIGYQTGEFPAFYTRSSGFNVLYHAPSAKEIASILKTKWDLHLNGGCVIANPIPEEYAMNPDEINAAIEEALNRARATGISGKQITPFLLSEIKKITKGKSLESNIQLVYHNAKVGALIAIEFCKLKEPYII